MSARFVGLGLLLALIGCQAQPVAGSGEDPPATSQTTAPDEDEGEDEGNEPEPPMGSTSLGFVPDNDVSQVSTCDPFLQDCDPGEKCVPYGSTGGNWDANKCVPVLGEGKIGDPCTYDGVVEATDSCDANSMCWNVGDVDGEVLGTCHPFCTGSPDVPMCPGGSSCSISCDGSLTVCIPNCDPLEQDCLGTGCYWDGSDFSCIFTTQDLEEGESCGFINDCKPGLMCASGEFVPGCEGSACCAAFCDIAAVSCSLEGTECVPFFEDGLAPEGQEHIGVCIDPSA